MVLATAARELAGVQENALKLNPLPSLYHLTARA
jgi:hypothetical protein